MVDFVQELGTFFSNPQNVLLVAIFAGIIFIAYQFVKKWKPSSEINFLHQWDKERFKAEGANKIDKKLDWNRVYRGSQLLGRFVSKRVKHVKLGEMKISRLKNGKEITVDLLDDVPQELKDKGLDLYICQFRQKLIGGLCVFKKTLYFSEMDDFKVENRNVYFPAHLGVQMMGNEIFMEGTYPWASNEIINDYDQKKWKLYVNSEANQIHKVASVPITHAHDENMEEKKMEMEEKKSRYRAMGGM